MNRAEVNQAIEKARAKHAGEADDSGIMQPVAVLVEELYGVDLYDKLPRKVQQHFFDIVVKVVMAAVTATDDKLMDLAEAVENLGGFDDLPDDDVEAIVLTPEVMRETFAEDFEPRQCGCGKPDSRHGLVAALEELKNINPGMLDFMLESSGVSKETYLHVRREVGL